MDEADLVGASHIPDSSRQQRGSVMMRLLGPRLDEAAARAVVDCVSVHRGEGDAPALDAAYAEIGAFIGEKTEKRHALARRSARGRSRRSAEALRWIEKHGRGKPVQQFASAAASRVVRR
jgi:hypothetical protein